MTEELKQPAKAKRAASKPRKPQAKKAETKPAAPKRVDLMIDIESLGTGDDTAVLSVGVVYFDILRKQTPAKLMKNQSFYVELGLEDQARHGRTIDPGTLAWHLNDDNRAAMLRAYFANHQKGSVEGLFETLATVIPEGSYVWANSPSFDCKILSSLGATFGYQFPAPFYQWMDFRTLKGVAKLAKIKLPNKKESQAHNALYDAAYQAQCVQHIVAKLGLVPTK